MSEKPNAIVIEIGSEIIRAGYANTAEPRMTFNLVDDLIVHDKKKSTDQSTDKSTNYRTDLIKHGLRKIFDEFGVDCPNTNVLLIDQVINSSEDRQKMTQMIFEEFHVGGLHIADNALLALYAKGINTGTVLYSDEGASYVVSIYMGQVIKHSITRVNICGRDLSNYLLKLLVNNDLNLGVFSQTQQKEIANNIKIKLCYVAEDYYQEINNVIPKSCEILDPNVYGSITLDKERIMCPDALFQPTLCDSNSISIQEAINESIKKCDVDIREDLYSNVILAGSNMMFPGLDARLNIELTILAPIKMKVKVIQSSDSDILAWKGGSILTSLNTFQSVWVNEASNAK